MLHRPRRLVRLILMCLALAALITGCRAVEPTPTPSPAEVKATTDAAVEAFVNAYPLAATAWDLDFFGPPEESVPLDHQRDDADPRSGDLQSGAGHNRV